MARFLFVVPPLVGHVNPTVTVAHELQARGHDVAWVAHPRAVRPLLPDGAAMFELDDNVPEERWKEGNAEAKAARGLAAFKFLWEEFLIPLGRQMQAGIAEAIDRFGPSVLVVDQQAVAGAIVARKRGMKWATLATTSAGITDPLAGLPLVRVWLDEQLASLEREAGLDSIALPDRSPSLVIAFTTPDLVGASDLGAHVHLVGPAFRARVEKTAFPWDALRDVPKVLISLGTVNTEAGDRFYETVIEAFAGDARRQMVLVAPERFAQRATPNLIIRPFVPQLALLEKVDAVVCHAGHNTTCEALANGLPLVVLPIKDDQPVVAEQVVTSGAGIRLKFGRVRAADLASAVDRILVEPSFRDAARRIASGFKSAGGAARAAALLEGLA